MQVAATPDLAQLSISVGFPIRRNFVPLPKLMPTMHSICHHQLAEANGLARPSWHGASMFCWQSWHASHEWLNLSMVTGL
jgi:hypothetical protein